MKPTDEKGVALILVMIMLAVLSIIAASLMAVSGAETSASMNYRLMTLSRYGGESAIHRAANYLMSSAYAATGPGGASDPLTNYGPTTLINNQWVVTYGGQPVVLSSDAGITSNYPLSDVISAFNAAAGGTLDGGSSPVSYTAVAELISMRQVTIFAGTTAVVQTWQITGKGSLSGSRPAQVEVSSILEQQVVPTFNYAAFATYDGCDALGWSGGGRTDSYDSLLGAGSVTNPPAGGDVGTNGNLTEAGASTIVGGSLSTPRVGVGNCSSGNVTAWTLNGNAQVTEGLIALPQPVVYPPPPVPTASPTGNLTVSNSQNLVKSPASSPCPSAPTQGCYGDITIRGTLHLTQGTYNINSLTMNGNPTLQIDSGPVILNVAGYSTPGVPGNCQVLPLSSLCMAIPFDMTGGTLVNAGLDPSMFQIQYVGGGQIKLAGGSTGAALLYAPNADAKLTGNGAWWGAIIAKYVDDTGGATIHYDKRLQKKMMTLGAFMLDSFTWRKF